MAFLDKMGKDYLDDDLIKEAMDFGGLHFNETFRKMGFSSESKTLDASLKAFREQYRPDTNQRFLRQQKNAAQNFDCAIFVPAPSVRVYLSALPPERKELRQQVLREAYHAAGDHLAANEQVRRCAGGVRREPAQGAYLLVMHGSTRSKNPQSCDHAHIVFANAAMNSEGRLFSVAGERRIANLKEADVRFQLKLAEGLEKHFGVKAELKEGRCELPGVSRKAIEVCTGAKAKEIQEKLKDAGFEATPRNKRLANDIIRKDAPRYSSFDGVKLQDSWRRMALEAQPTLLEDVKLKAGQKLDTMQRLVQLQSGPRALAPPTHQVVIRQHRRNVLRIETADVPASASTTRPSSLEQGTATQGTSALASNGQISPENRSHNAKLLDSMRRDQQRTMASQRRPVEVSPRIQRYNKEKRQRSRDFMKREKSWIGQQARETWKTAKTILAARYKGDRKIVKVRDFEAFQDLTRTRSIAEGHRAARDAVRSTRVRSFKHALEVAQEGYRQGRSPKLQLPRGSHVFLAENLKLDAQQIRHLQTLQKKHGLHIHQGKERNVDLSRRLAETQRNQRTRSEA